ncbi:carbohydrate-binding protein [Corynebacterium hansenii]|uniref:Carbohydrate-binding protein n=1 Tax=Corynebacterium hansenii TaxID=394964 RepID=A0ABV7ZSI2_9CORY|nr:carbohydrate-binding protein [Corynebacterium hansenii]WJZ00650.1 Chitinase A1 precursor [Corynebacterium hansenii]
MRDFDLKSLSDAEFLVLRYAVLEEKRRRDAAPAVEEALDEAAREYHEENPPEADDDGVPRWRQPHGAFDAWPVGAVVAHVGKRWRNVLAKVNVWEPGNDGPVPTWEEVRAEPPADGQTPPVDKDPEPEPEPSPPEWAPGVAYVVGETVTHGGATYRVVQAHTSQTGWEPPAVPALWAKV